MIIANALKHPEISIIILFSTVVNSSSDTPNFLESKQSSASEKLNKIHSICCFPFLASAFPSTTQNLMQIFKSVFF
jgi:hypothetical protein